MNVVSGGATLMWGDSSESPGFKSLHL